jgi:predicted dienelactone hydrolase
MRAFEVVLWLATSAWAVLWLMPSATRRIERVPPVVATLVLAVHAALEGVRVQMIPIYALLATLLVLTPLQARWPLARRLGGWPLAGARVLTTGWISVAAALPLMFPVFSYERPDGPYGIGTAVYAFASGSRHRPLVVQAWYPAAAGATGRRAGITTHPALLQRALAGFTGVPAPLFDNLRLVRTHAIEEVEPASDRQRFPVVLFSHGPIGANRSQSIFQMEALASAGFVVVAIDHAGYASTAIFPDGRAVLPGPDAAWPVFVDARSTTMLKTWVSDVSFVLDRLAEVNERDPAGILSGRLDLARVGYVGASFGGSAVVQALLDEPRLKAGVAEDGKPYFSDDTLTDLRRPLMYMQSAAPYIKSSDAQLARWGLNNAEFRAAEQDHYARQMQLFARAGGPIYNVYIRRTNHLTFSDLGLIVRVPDSQLMGVRRAHSIINAYTVAFFEHYLNRVDAPLVDGRTPSPYEEVTVASRNVIGWESVADNAR